jgi:putative RNA 2'-phosphotransferase
MKPNQSVQKLSKFIAYVLGRRPDEFGLVPDSDGYIKIKEFLQAVSVEEGWRHVRRSHINEVLLTQTNPGFEINDNLIRASLRQHLPERTTVTDPPALLFTCIRKKAYPFIFNKGIFPQGRSQVILTADSELAERIGKRKDQQPVLLTIHTHSTLDKGVIYQCFGEGLYLADFIPPDCFTGPPLPKDRPEARKPEPTQKEPARVAAGSFTLDLKNDADRIRTPGMHKKRKKQDWKKERRRQRRHKEKW